MAGRLIDGPLGAQLRLEGRDGNAVRLHAAVAAALADGGIDEHPLVGVRKQAALAAPAILGGAGCSRVHVNVAQPVGRRPDGYEGDVKLTAPITLETIAATILTLGLADQEELDTTVDDLYRLAADDETLIGAPRMVQAWGYRPA